MPGILPMKVIKVGTAAQSRIAQACDRCRSKKIRCDGIRPSCTQCVNVGFECKTSDKLSRRAFPRGYTESLEERVRILEAEVRELKDLLDEKDEKIDMLSRIHSHSHSHSPPSNHIRRTPNSPLPTLEICDGSLEKDETFKVQQSPLLLDDENRDTYFVGSSSGRAFVGMVYSFSTILIYVYIANIEQSPSNNAHRKLAGRVPMSIQMPFLGRARKHPHCNRPSALLRSKRRLAWSPTR
jgi:hypothetical protein